MSDTDRGNSGILRFLMFFEICRFPNAPANSWCAYCRAVADSREASGKTRTVKAKKMTSTVQLIGCVLFLSLFPLVYLVLLYKIDPAHKPKCKKKSRGEFMKTSLHKNEIVMFWSFYIGNHSLLPRNPRYKFLLPRRHISGIRVRDLPQHAFALFWLPRS